MDVRRFAVIGVGANVFNMHAPALQSDQIEIAAVCDVNLAAAERQAERFGCPYFADHREMLGVIRPDAAAVLVPHPFHAAIAIDCLNAGAHVLVEKPIAVDVAEADQMIAAAERAGRLLAVNLQQRTRSEIRTAKKLIESGRLGQIQRVEMVAIWTRTAAYYAQAGWRGTWRGEGGGVLMNQSPHSLDLICHLVGQPSRVVAWNRTLFHRIETEDTSLAILEWSADRAIAAGQAAARVAPAGAAGAKTDGADDAAGYEANSTSGSKADGATASKADGGDGMVGANADADNPAGSTGGAADSPADSNADGAAGAKAEGAVSPAGAKADGAAGAKADGADSPAGAKADGAAGAKAAAATAAGGAVGTLLVSTAQIGEPERLEIAGTRGVLLLTRGGLRLFEAETDLRTFLAESREPFAKPDLVLRDVPLESGSGDHAAIYANCLAATDHGAPLVADGAEGRLSLELANALIYSSATNTQVSLPLDRNAYAALLETLRAATPTHA